MLIFNINEQIFVEERIIRLCFIIQFINIKRYYNHLSINININIIIIIKFFIIFLINEISNYIDVLNYCLN